MEKYKLSVDKDDILEKLSWVNVSSQTKEDILKGLIV